MIDGPTALLISSVFHDMSCALLVVAAIYLEHKARNNKP
jgi:hypothetical protein